MQEKNNSSAKPTDITALTEKLLALYRTNRTYIDEAEKFLCPATQKNSPQSCTQSISQADIDRLYSHVFVLEHIAKLLHEEFLTDKNGRKPAWSSSKENPQHESSHE